MAFLLAALFLSLPALADWTKTSSKEFEVADYPETGSAAYKQDFTLLLKYQQERSEKDCNLALTQRFPKFELFFGGSAGLFSAEEIDALKPFFTKLGKLGERITDYFKHQYDRPRPYDEDNRVKPCADKPPGSLAYPSAHATISTLDACVLAELYPKREKKIVDYGKYLGDLRAIVGVHHPSDVKAGQELGQDICAYLLEDDSFKEDLAALKKDL